MKIISLTFLMLLLCQSAFSQSKKDLLESLSSEVENLKQLLVSENANTKNKIQSLEDQLSLLNKKILEFQVSTKTELIKNSQENKILREEIIELKDSIFNISQRLDKILKSELNLKNNDALTEEDQMMHAAKARFESYLAEFIKRNNKEGTLDFFGVEAIGINYSLDGIRDYILTCRFDYGGDFTAQGVFFYNSEIDQIQKLDFDLAIKSTLEFSEIKNTIGNKLTSTLILFQAFSGIHFIEKSLEVGFSIRQNKIIFDPNEIIKINKMDLETSKELENLKK